ncbi:MAG: integrase arm-type DNA-binding domain-containing protein [Azoarcus sp.]|nr:integrase arm-type DNA-binding domain-containing protein [Azoarcus sp.]
MAGVEKLSASRVARISKPGKYGDGKGLYLQVTKNMSKSWVFRYEMNGAEHYMGLGPLHTVNIDNAREEARKARTCIARGIDPLRERALVAAQNKSMNTNRKTFDDCAAQYIENHKKGWKSEKHQKQWEYSLRTYVSPRFGKINVCDITTSHVLKVLEPIWATKTETAARLRERIERILSWAATLGYRDAENPARWDGHLQELLPPPARVKPVRHHPSMSYHEIGAFFSRLGNERGVAARALQFVILTACRTSEAQAATWQEIDLAQRLWVIPAARMKCGRQHRIPLADAALSILDSLQGAHPEWVFPGGRGRPLHGSAMLDVLRRMNRGDVTVHGFRSSFRIWAAERTAYPREILELALAHRQGTQVEEAYQRSDLAERRRALMLDWAAWCATIQSPPEM